MADTIRARLNHYQMLGVSPTASGDEIARAFAREGSVLRPHVFGVLAELCVAYETLRNPIKRRAYDASIGLERKQTLQTLSAGARQALMAQGPAPAIPVRPQTPAVTSHPKSQPMVHGNSETPAKPALPLGPGADLNIRPEPRISRTSTISIPLEEELAVEARPIDWRRAGLVLGTLVVAACAVGGMAGWWSAGGVGEAAQPDNAVSVSLPRARPVAVPAAPEIKPAPVTEPIVAAARSDLPRPGIATAARIEPTPTDPEPVTAEAEPQQDQADLSLGGPAAAAAPMPLPDRVIARTIQSIGYSCGSVASTAPVEGEAPGVYKVTCSSGQAYQARPVNGRYHFRRWGKR